MRMTYTASILFTGLGSFAWPPPQPWISSISEPALTSYAQSLPEQERSSFRQERVGLFTIDTAQRWKGITHLGVANAGGMLIKCGFAYVPDGRVEDLGVSSSDHVTGDWYATCTDYD